MKHPLTILLASVGVVMLVTGYTAPQRGEANIKAYNKSLESARMWIATKEGEEAAAQSKRDFDYRMQHPEEKAPDPMLSKIDELEKKQSDILKNNREEIETFLEEESYKQRGAIQYCTGWLLLAAAAIISKFGHRNDMDHAA
jgi:hypothetical protein